MPALLMALFFSLKTKDVMRVKKAASNFPKNLRPALATLIDKPFDSNEWLYEIKWDGYRALAFMNGTFRTLKSRNDKSFDEKFYPVYEAIKKWNINAIADGEIVMVDEWGLPTFGGLQNWRSEADGQLVYYIFDLLWLNGKDLTGLPLTERRKMLEANLPPDNAIIRLSEAVDANGNEMLEIARKMGLEGIMAKRKASPYTVNNRTKDWLKIKSNKRQEMVIGGYTINDDTSKPFSSLLVGVYQKGKLIYTGKVGTGFDIATQKKMMKQFKPFIIKKPAFFELPDINKPSRFRPNPPHARAIFIKPVFVCEVSYAELTKDGIMRHPSFEGMRIDKKATEVSLEVEKPADKILKSAKVKAAEKKIAAPLTKNRLTLLNPSEETQVKKVNGHPLKFTNLSKIYWPEDQVTKRDLINYYYQVAPVILPYLKGRPQSMNRFPNGIHGESFYQKDVTGKAPGWIKTYLYHSEADHKDRHFLVPTNEASILWMVGLGSIELNPWSSTIKKPDKPTWCIIDLDPDNNSFEQVIEAAQVTKAVLDDLGVACYPKTSGSTGLHIYIPLGEKYTYEQSKEFARAVATMVHNELPKYTTIERMTKNRKGKMYIDFLQNRPQATIAAPYSVRPKIGATVSMPLHWDEVKKGLKMKDFTIRNAVERIKSEGDLFKPVLGKGIDLKKAIRFFSSKAEESEG